MLPKRSDRSPRPDRSSEFASLVIHRPRAVMACRLDMPQAATARVKVAPKTPGRLQQSIRDAARGEECLLALPGCPRDPAMTVWSHNRHSWAGKGGAIKALDLNGCLACTRCDAIYDGQVPRPADMTRDQVELAWYHAHAKSLVRLRQKGVL